MNTTIARVVIAGLLLGTPGLGAAQPAPPDVNDVEIKCMANVAKAASKLVVGRMKCTSKCVSLIWKGLLLDDPATCFVAPYNNAFMDACMDKVESKFTLSELKKCDTNTTPTADCPECYSGGNCVADAPARTSQVAAAIDGFGPDVYCERTGAFLLEMRCQTTVAKVIPKYVAKLIKCHDKCFALARKGLVGIASCGPPATDPTTQTCLAEARTNAVDAMDHDCGPPPASPDACGDPYPTGSAWADRVEAVFLPEVADTYCASPSGAFVD